MFYALIDSQNRLAAISELESAEDWKYPEGFRVVEAGDFVPDPGNDYFDYEYRDGGFVYVEPPAPPLEPVEVLTAIFAAQPETMDALPDEALARMAPYMQPWETGKSYSAGDKVQYEDQPYRCLQAHMSQEVWNPADAPSLWAKILIPDPTVIPEWEQPGSTNPYMKGDKVRHAGKVWVSDVDNNVWEPGVYGWTEIEE